MFPVKRFKLVTYVNIIHTSAVPPDPRYPLPKNEFAGGRLALDFCNSFSRGPGKGPRDRLGAPDMVLAWAARAGWPLEAAPGADDVAALHEFRAALIGMFDRLSEGEAPDPRHIERLNVEIARAGASEYLAPEGTGRWRLVDRAGEALERLRHAIARDAADLLTGDLARLKRCPAHDCLWLFHDSSKNLSRRWCAMDDCGSRAKMRRHRARSGF
jgi:predicted RNA-binding Zn ribbon-like protein